MSIKDPWSGLSPPARADNVTALRVDENLNWDIYWAVDLKRNCLLILQHHIEVKPTSKLPKFKGLQMEAQSVDDGHHRLILRLLERDQREIFHRLCLDIISAIDSAQSEDQVIQRFLNRTWRWHRLLKGNKDNRLSQEEQRGLYGELMFLEKHLFPFIGIPMAVESWKGPLGFSQDFQVGQTHIEVKTKRELASSHVIISSEFQLASSDLGILFLHVVEVITAEASNSEATTITHIADRVKSKIIDNDLSTVDQFEDLLVAAGFDWEEDYSDCYWLQGEDYLYKVTEGFPRITPSMCPAGVENLRYSIALKACEQFCVEKKELIEALGNGFGTRN